MNLRFLLLCTLSFPFALFAQAPDFYCDSQSDRNFTMRSEGDGHWVCSKNLLVSTSGVGINADPSSFWDLRVRDKIGIGNSPQTGYNLSVDGRVWVDDRLGIGTSPSYELDVDGKAHIDDGLGVGTYPPYSGLQVGSSSNFYVKTSLSSGSGTPLVISSGEVKKQSSSRRYKDRIRPLGKDLDEVLDLRPVKFRYAPEKGGDGSEDIGLIAEEVEEVLPDLVIYGENEAGEVQAEGVKYDRLSLYLLEVVKKQNQKIEALEERLNAMEPAQ